MWEVYVTSVAAVIITVLNFSCIFLIVRTPVLRITSNVALCGLLFVHLMQGLFVMPLYAAKRADVTTNPDYILVLCDSFRFSYMVTNYGSCLCLTVMTVDRLISARFPLHYHVHKGLKTVSAALLVVWTYVIVLCTIPFMPNGNRSNDNCSYSPQREWVIFMLVFHTLCPFIFLLLSYVYVFMKVKTLFTSVIFTHDLSIEYATRGEGSQRRRSSLRNIKAQWNAAKTSFLIVICYILCWGPSFVFYFIAAVCPECYSKEFLESPTEDHISFLIKFFTFMDGLLAPLIYCAKNRTFRELFYRQSRSVGITSKWVK